MVTSNGDDPSTIAMFSTNGQRHFTLHDEDEQFISGVEFTIAVTAVDNVGLYSTKVELGPVIVDNTPPIVAASNSSTVMMSGGTTTPPGSGGVNETDTTVDSAAVSTDTDTLLIFDGSLDDGSATLTLSWREDAFSDPEDRYPLTGYEYAIGM